MAKTNVEKALDKMKLEDLTPAEKVGKVSNLIEPSEAMCKEVIERLVAGESYKKIKKEVREVVTEKRMRDVLDEQGEKTGEEEYDHQLSAKGLSIGQIRDIDVARLAKLEELSPKQEDEVLELEK